MRGRVQLSATEVLLASLIGGAALGLVGVFMAIPIAAGVKVLLAERLQARDAADPCAGAPADGEMSPPPGPAQPGPVSRAAIGPARPLTAVAGPGRVANYWPR